MVGQKPGNLAAPRSSEVKNTGKLLGIPSGRSKGVVFHDTRHSAVTNLVGPAYPSPRR